MPRKGDGDDVGGIGGRERGEKRVASSSLSRVLAFYAWRRTNLHRYTALKEQREGKKRRGGKSREKKSEIPIRPGGLKFFRDVLAAARNRNAGCSRQGGGKRGDEIAGRAKSRPLYVSGAIRGLVFSRDPFRTLRPPSISRNVTPLNAAFSPRRLLVSKTYKTTTNQSETVAVRRTVARVSGPNDFFPRGKVGNPVEKIRTRPRPCPSNAGPGVISHH